MNISHWLVLLCLVYKYAATSSGFLNVGLQEKLHPYSGFALFSDRVDNPRDLNHLPGINVQSNIAGHKIEHAFSPVDSLPQTNNVTVVIPFEYQQSSLNYSYTFKLIDSVAEILLQNDSVTLSIEGYSYLDEGNDNICYYLSLNRALAVKYYVVGRGVDSSRVITLIGRSKLRSIQRKATKEAIDFNCTAEIILNYPIPLPGVTTQDMDEDGISDEEDSCRSEYGDKAHGGCPNNDAIIIPFEMQQSSLFSLTYRVLDSVILILRNDPLVTISIEGHAYKKEGVKTVCDRLAKERADIVKRYLLTRRIPISRINSIKSFGTLQPISAGRNYSEMARNSRAQIFLFHH